jgi:surfeit locus 1 family protein
MRAISFSIANGTFTIRPYPTLIFLIMLAVLIGLGTWQIQRLHWKENLIANINQRIHQTPVDISTITDPDHSEYQPVQATGLLQHDMELYLLAISTKGEGGYHVLTPLQLDDGRYLLVDRGWVPYDRGRGPGVRGQEENIFRPIGPVTITGILRLPHHGWLQPANRPDENQWSWVDLPAMAKATHIPELAPFYLEADAASNSEEYPVGGQTIVDLPNNHLSYAITWYGLALALVIIYGVSGFRKVS